MRWNIKGFDQYEVDEAGQVWAKPQSADSATAVA